jgi:hypothetical protein
VEAAKRRLLPRGNPQKCGQAWRHPGSRDLSSAKEMSEMENMKAMQTLTTGTPKWSHSRMPREGTMRNAVEGLE